MWEGDCGDGDCWEGNCGDGDYGEGDCGLDVYYVTDVIIKISVGDVIIKRFLRSIQ